MPAPKGFWEELGIPIEDLLAKQTEAESVQNLATKLQSLSEEFLATIKDAFTLPGTSLLESLWTLRSQFLADFNDLYALAVFAERTIDPEIIYRVATGKFQGNLNDRILSRTIDEAIVLFSLLCINLENIRKIYYDNEIQQSTSKRYVSEHSLHTPIDIEKVDSKTIESLLRAHELKKTAKNRRPIKLWWFDKSDGVLTVVFRREKKGSTEIKLVARNIFTRTGDEKVFKIAVDGNSLELFSKHEPKRTIQLIEYMVGQLTGKVVRYGIDNSLKEPEKVSNFILRLCSNDVPNTKLLNIRVKNAPLPNSPTIELDCTECLVPALNELNEAHGLSLIRPPQDLISLTIERNGKSYRLKSRTKDGKIALNFDNRNLRGSDKEQLKQFLDEQLR